MDNYTIEEVKIILCLWSDVYSRYMVRYNPEYTSRWRVVCAAQYSNSSEYCTTQTTV